MLIFRCSLKSLGGPGDLKVLPGVPRESLLLYCLLSEMLAMHLDIETAVSGLGAIAVECLMTTH